MATKETVLQILQDEFDSLKEQRKIAVANQDWDSVAEINGQTLGLQFAIGAVKELDE